MKLYTIIGGVNGCGKSSLTGALKAERSDLGIIIDVDKLNAQLGGVLEGGKAAIRKIDECLEMGVSFTQETTLSGTRTERTIRREDVERRFSTRFADVLRVLPYCDEARFFDNDNGFVEVAEYRNGELFPRVANPPRWLRELRNKMA